MDTQTDRHARALGYEADGTSKGDCLPSECSLAERHQDTRRNTSVHSDTADDEEAAQSLALSHTHEEVSVDNFLEPHAN